MKQDLSEIKLIVHHCSATAIDKPYEMANLTRDHKARGINEPCGYHFYVRRDGTRHKGRPIDTVGAHARGYNTNSIGICYEGGIIAGGRANVASHAKDTRTDAQKKEIKNIIIDLYHELGDYQDCTDIKHVGHRDLSPDKDGNGVIDPWEYMKQCPCYNVDGEHYGLLINKSVV
jgi:N-acetylmuramoyl-L-alanine amidase